MALLDAILEAEWQYRYYSFNAHWSSTEQMGSMRNGSGDDFFSVFDANGCFLKGFAHEAAMSPYRIRPPHVWPGVLDEVPTQYAASVREPAFKVSDTTFCIWRAPEDVVWHRGRISFPSGDDPDGSASLLSPLDGVPETYRAWAEDYYERPVAIGPVVHVYRHQPLDSAVLEALDCSRSLVEVSAEAHNIGYPSNAAA